jgi:hypothetical protein
MDTEYDSMPVEDMIASVKKAVALAGLSDTSPDRDLKVGSVHLTLRVVAAKAGGAQVSFRVPFIGMKLSGGVKVSKHNTHTVNMALRSTGAAAGHEVRGDVIGDALASAIKTIRAAMASAATGNEPWALSSGTVDLEFAVGRGGSISLGAEGDLSNEATHTLQLELLPP